MKIILSFLFAASLQATAEETTCAVKGMHCQGCTEMVEGKVCDEAKYSTCTVKVLDAKKQTGEIHLVTKDATAKVDEKAVGKLVEDSGYKMLSCKPKKSS